MAPAITDAYVVSALKVVVHGSGPVLDALTHTDPFHLKARTHERPDPEVAEVRSTSLKNRAVGKAVDAFYQVEFPGTAAWQSMTPQQRTTWWMNRVGRFTTLIVAIPGFGGVVADRLPLQPALGSASQAMLLCAMAREWGVTDEVEQVRMLAWVLCDRDVSRALVEGTAAKQEEQPGKGSAPERGALVGAARALWRYARVLRGILGELDKRPQGRLPYRALGKVPVVGLAGDYLSEHSALKRAVRKADKWVRSSRHTTG
ncbi:hypothetical protein [Rhodococcus sp. X156]|uniref:hypothetical protein n=1 Tax=Rhodococcus sp. X156 TaxID=2499145 RepID=UPI000FDAC715|nr:hypothetical protein [Rhodococcus sp. X156]